MTELTSQAGLYLHTFGFVQPFGMPVSIAEAMACGAVPIVRESPAARSYAGESALYYDTMLGRRRATSPIDDGSVVKS